MQAFKHHKTRDIGDILTDSFQYIRIHYITLGKALLFFVLPLYIIQFFLLKGYTDQIFATIQSGAFEQSNSIFGPRYFLGIAISLIASSVLTCVTLKHLQLTQDGLDPSPELILEDIVPNTLKLTGLYIIFMFVLFFSALFFLIPMFFFGVKLCLSASSLILEEETVFGSLGRSWEITKDYWWSTFAVVVVMYIMMFMVGFAIQFPATLIALFVTETGTAEAANPSVLSNIFLVISGIITAVSSLISAVFFIALSLQFYSLVERKEGGTLRTQIEGLLD